MQVISDSRPEIVANYVVWRAVMSALPYLHREARMAQEDFERAMGKTRFVRTVLIGTTSSSHVRRYTPKSLSSRGLHPSIELSSIQDLNHWSSMILVLYARQFCLGLLSS